MCNKHHDSLTKEKQQNSSQDFATKVNRSARVNRREEPRSARLRSEEVEREKILGQPFEPNESLIHSVDEDDDSSTRLELPLTQRDIYPDEDGWGRWVERMRCVAD